MTFPRGARRQRRRGGSITLFSATDEAIEKFENGLICRWVQASGLWREKKNQRKCDKGVVVYDGFTFLMLAQESYVISLLN